MADTRQYREDDVYTKLMLRCLGVREDAEQHENREPRMQIPQQPATVANTGTTVTNPRTTAANPQTTAATTRTTAATTRTTARTNVSNAVTPTCNVQIPDWQQPQNVSQPVYAIHGQSHQFDAFGTMEPEIGTSSPGSESTMQSVGPSEAAEAGTSNSNGAQGPEAEGSDNKSMLPEEEKVQTEESRMQMIEKLKKVKREWRVQEAEEQNRLNEMSAGELTQLMKIVFALRGGKVKKRELPWYLGEVYDVPSNSEDEREFENQEADRKKTGQSRYRKAPTGATMYMEWLSVIGQLESEESEESYDTDSEASSDGVGKKEGISMDMTISPDSDSDIELENNLWMESMSDNNLETDCGPYIPDISTTNVPEHLKQVMKGMKETREQQPCPVADPREVWNTTGKREHSRERMPKPKQRKTKAELQAETELLARRTFVNNLDGTDTSDDDNTCIGGFALMSPTDLKAKPSFPTYASGKGHKLETDMQEKPRPYDSFQHAGFKPSAEDQYKSLHQNKSMARRVSFIDAGYEGGSESDEDQFIIGGLGFMKQE